MSQKIMAALAATLIVTACAKHSGDSAPAAAEDMPVRAAHGELARIRAQGGEKTAREVTAIEYPIYRELMKAAGLDAALGGEAPADAALRGLFAAYERKVRSLQADLPKLMPVAYTGIDIGYSGFAASMVTGGLQNDAAIAFWERAQGEGKPNGSHARGGNGSSVDMQWSDAHSAMTTSFEGEMPGGLSGKITTRVEVDTCPAADGKVTARFTSDSSLRAKSQAGTGGFIKVAATVSKFLDDDAHLVDDRIESEVRVEQKTLDSYEGAFVDVTDTLSTTTGEMGSKVTGRSKRAPDASVQGAQDLAKMGRLAAMQALEGAKKAWESGRCIDLKATSEPGKRTGVKPLTKFQVLAAPRVKSDGSFPGGTVLATLAGGESLTRNGEKVRADGQYAYVAPAQKDKQAAITFEARSKRGVGRATLEFDTKERQAYRIKGGQNDFFANVVTCSIREPFDIRSTVGIVMHMSGGEGGGTWTMSGQAAYATWSGGGTYTVSLEGEEEGGWLEAKGISTVTHPVGRASDSVAPVFSLTPVDSCE